MNKHIKVSVIMPSLNVANYIDEAISSVRSQTLEDIEIICVDAGSTDGTVEIIKKHCAMDDRIKYIHSAKKSYGYQLNQGINEVRGDYFGIVETDDYVESNMYKVLFETAEVDNLDFVKADYKAFITQENGERFYLTRKNFSDDNLYGKVICPRLYTEVATGDWYNCQGIYKTKFIKENNIVFSETPGAAFQDIGFLYKAIVKAERVMYLKDSFYRYRIDREESSSNSGRGIKYSYDEFKRLTDDSNEYKNLSETELIVLYVRMVKSFISSYGDVDDYCTKIEALDRQRYYEWLKSKISDAVRQGFLQKEYMNQYLWEAMTALIESEKKLKDYQTEKERKIDLFLSNTLEADVIIFGCGNYGFKVYKLLDRKNVKVNYFTDNNMELWGKTFCEVEIIPPNKINEIDNKRIIIANELFHEEIKRQLISMGISDDEMMVFGNA